MQKKEGPVTFTQPKSPVSESYRTLRTNLGFSSVDRPCRSILVTSPNPKEGKSTTAANLAVTLAQAGNRVILVDADLRKPMQHKIFDLGNLQGLTNCIMQDREPGELVQQAGTENLDVLTSGPIPPNPAELLGSERSSTFWSRLLESYEYAIVDAPPVLAVTDAAILANLLEGVILVVRSGSTRNDLAKKALEQLNKANARIIGTVLNGLNMNSSDYQYYYYYAASEAVPKKNGLRSLI